MNYEQYKKLQKLYKKCLETKTYDPAILDSVHYSFMLLVNNIYHPDLEKLIKGTKYEFAYGKFNKPDLESNQMYQYLFNSLIVEHDNWVSSLRVAVKRKQPDFSEGQEIKIQL